MRVLLTNNTLAGRAGTELYVRDVAPELARRGHQPMAYSTSLGAVAEELQAAGVPVAQKLSELSETPDIIHGPHHYDTLTAMLWFPDAPAVYFCHGAVPWEEKPFRFPQILRYVAVDEACRGTAGLERDLQVMQALAVDRERQINEIHGSATWRWTQGLLRNPFVRRLFGRTIQRLAQKSRPEPGSAI